MPLHANFPRSPYAILEPAHRWVPAVDDARNNVNENVHAKLLPPLVHKIREEVHAWRARDYAGASDTSRALLTWWFATEHVVQHADGMDMEFRYYFAQREAVESVVYLYDVKGVKDKHDLMRYDSSGKVASGWFAEDWLRMVLKMATGTGKTKVMSLLIAWAYFHKHYETTSQLAQNFLVIAPNIIVLDRLRADLDALRIFYHDPVLPENGFAGKNWRDDFQLTVHVQDEVRPTGKTGNLFLTNIHRVYCGDELLPSFDDDDTKDYFLGRKPTGATTDSKTDLGAIVREVDELIVFNDEAHHIHHPKLAWFQSIQDIHNKLVQKQRALSLQIDLTATPKDEQGNMFAQTIADYPLVEAIYHNILKQPVLPDEASQVKLQERRGIFFSEKYADHLALGVAEWRKASAQFAKLGKKAILFVMTDDTNTCDEVAAFLEKTNSDLANAILVIHTNKSGDVSESKSGKAPQELEELRKQANTIDHPDNPFKAIVSVMMLKEGWDVRNVTTIVGLRAYKSPSKILPEQTLGRGLRRMLPEQSDAQERLSVIGTDAFMEFVESIKSEGVLLAHEQMGAGTGAKTPTIIEVDKDNESKDLDALDIAIPVLSPRLYRDHADLERLNAAEFGHTKVALKNYDDEASEIVFVHYESEEVSHTTKIDAHAPPDPSVVIAHYTRAIMKELHLIGGYDVLYGKVKEFLQRFLFERAVDLSERNILRNLSDEAVAKIIMDTFKKTINDLTVRDRGQPTVTSYIALSDTRPFMTDKKDLYESVKSVFNKVVADNPFERDFGIFLERCADVKKYAKFNQAINFKLEYQNEKGDMANYYPDFIVQRDDGTCYIVETKGREELDVPHKMQRLRQWCDDVNRTQNDTRFDFVYVPQDDYEQYHPRSFMQVAESFTEYRKADVTTADVTPSNT